MKKTVGIAGLGLIGASMALALREKDYEVLGTDRDPEVIRKALERGMIRRGSTQPGDILPEADILILAMYPGAILDYALEHKNLFRPDQIITDVAGLKGRIVRRLQEELEPEFLGGHPMAGRETSGLDSAREELFLGTSYILTPTEKNTQAALSVLTALAKDLGAAQVRTMSPEAHDGLVAYTSHMPHLLALALMDIWEEGSQDMAGGSFRDATRVARINETLWGELFLENKEELLPRIRRFQEALGAYGALLEAGDRKALEERMRQAKGQKERMEP